MIGFEKISSWRSTGQILSSSIAINNLPSLYNNLRIFYSSNYNGGAANNLFIIKLGTSANPISRLRSGDIVGFTGDFQNYSTQTLPNSDEYLTLGVGGSRGKISAQIDLSYVGDNGPYTDRVLVSSRSFFHNLSNSSVSGFKANGTIELASFFDRISSITISAPADAFEIDIFQYSFEIYGMR